MHRIVFSTTVTKPRLIKEETFKGCTKIFLCKAAPFGCPMGESYTQGFPAGQVTPHKWSDEGYYLELPYIPKPKTRPRVTQNGTYNPHQSEIEAMHWQLKAQRPFQQTLEGPLLLMMHFIYPAAARPKYSAPASRPDIDNLTGNVLDAGNGCLWFDDAQIVELHVSKSYFPVKDCGL